MISNIDAEVFVTMVIFDLDISVYNWTVEDVSEWLVIHVELAQYVQTFKNGNIDGKMLPRWV